MCRGGGGGGKEGYVYIPHHIAIWGEGRGRVSMVVCVCACVCGRRSEEKESFGAYIRESPIPSHPSILVCPPVVVIARGGVVVVLEYPNIHACSVNTIPPPSLSLSHPFFS